jgi:hypothetical protein
MYASKRGETCKPAATVRAVAAYFWPLQLQLQLPRIFNNAHAEAQNNSTASIHVVMLIESFRNTASFNTVLTSTQTRQQTLLHFLSHLSFLRTEISARGQGWNEGVSEQARPGPPARMIARVSGSGAIGVM